MLVQRRGLLGLLLIAARGSPDGLDLLGASPRSACRDPRAGGARAPPGGAPARAALALGGRALPPCAAPDVNRSGLHWEPKCAAAAAARVVCDGPSRIVCAAANPANTLTFSTSNGLRATAGY